MLALNTTAVAWVLFAVILAGWVVYLILNVGSAKREIGSEIELAANRKPYYDDEVLEGRRLERVQLLGVLLLIVVVVGLPLYWVLEPSRLAGAREYEVDEFTGWGAAYFETAANGGFDCAGCHGGMTATGGAKEYALEDPTTGEVRMVQWKAPALNTVFYRFDEEEVRFILTYGRPFSPMSAWGVDGGGALNDQQIDTVIVYLKSIQIEPVDCTEAGADPLTIEVPDPNIDDPDPVICDGGKLPKENRDEIATSANTAADALVSDGDYATRDEAMGEALFNLELASGAFSCARCHTQGWSYDDPGQPGQGALGWNLTGGATSKHFPSEQSMKDFVTTGSENGVVYGEQGQGSGKMPAFGQMLTPEQIDAVVDYVRSL